MSGSITIDPIHGVAGNDIISSFDEANALVYSGTEQGLDGAHLGFLYQIDYGSDPKPWTGGYPTTAVAGRWATTVAPGYTSASVPDGVYTITAKTIDVSVSVSASRQLIQADHPGTANQTHSPFEAVGLAFDGETQQLASSPSFVQVDQYITAEQAGIGILQSDNIITTSQATKLQDFFSQELKVLGSQALSSDLLSAKQINTLTHLQANTAQYVSHTRALVAMQPNGDGWTMPVMGHSS